MLLILAAIFVRQRKSIIFIYLIFFILGSLVFKNTEILPENHILRLLPHIQKKIYLEGIIVNNPVCTEKKCKFLLRPKFLFIDEYKFKVTGDVLTYIYKNNKFTYGQHLVLQGKIRRPYNFSKDFSYRSYLRGKRIYAILRVSKEDSIKIITTTLANPFKYLAFKFSNKIKDIFDSNLEDIQAKVLDAIILGQRQRLPKYIRENFIKTGTAHILAVSGLHVGIIAFIFLVFLKSLAIPKNPRYIITISLLIFYCLVTGMRISVIRATLMATIILIGFILQRPINLYNSLAFSALLILLFNPNELFSVGFQLSFISVISILALTPRIERLLRLKPFKNQFLKFIIRSFTVSLSAWLGTLPLILYYFKIISPITILANLIIVPYMSIVLALGLFLAISGLSLPILAPTIAATSNISISILLLITHFLSKIPGSYFYIR